MPLQIETVSQNLHQELSQYPWFLAIAIGADESGQILYVYVKTRKAVKEALATVGKIRDGYKIIVKKLGTPKAST